MKSKRELDNFIRSRVIWEFLTKGVIIKYLVMRIIILCLFFIFSNDLYGQLYGHKLFPIGNKSLNAAGIFLNNNNDRAFVPTVYYPGDTSTVITFDPQGNNRLDVEIPAFLMPKNSFVQLDNFYYFYGKTEIIQNDLQIIQMDMSNQVIWQQNFETDLDASFPNDIVAIEDHLYITAVNDRVEPYHREINVKKINFSGQEVWSRNYNSTSYSSYPTKAVVSSDDNLLLSAIFRHQLSVPFTTSQITKINSLGNVIWEVLGEEKARDGAVRVDLAELSNGNLVQLYEVDKFDDFEYRSVYNPFPVRMDWYDAEGNFLFHKYIEYPNVEQFERGDVTAGNGDYFFLTGAHLDNELPSERYGVVTKFDNQGDTIWTKQYYHPNYPEPNDRRFIRNMIELENGDLLLLGMTGAQGSFNEVWFMRVNEHGCFGTTECDDLVTSTETNLDLSLLDIKIFPNPVTDILQITSSVDHPIKQAKLYDLNGQAVAHQLSNDPTKMEISVADFPEGMYVLSFELKSGRILTELVRVSGK